METDNLQKRKTHTSSSKASNASKMRPEKKFTVYAQKQRNYYNEIRKNTRGICKQ